MKRAGFKHIHPQANNPQAGVASYLPFQPSSPPPNRRRASPARAHSSMGHRARTGAMTVNAVLMAEAEAAVLARRSEMLEDERSCMSTQYRKASPLPPRSSTCSPVFQRPEGQGDREDEGEGRDWAWSQTGVLGSWSGPRQTHTSSPRYTGTASPFLVPLLGPSMRTQRSGGGPRLLLPSGKLSRRDSGTGRKTLKLDSIKPGGKGPRSSSPDLRSPKMTFSGVKCPLGRRLGADGSFQADTFFY